MHEESTEEEEMKRQQRMKIVKDGTKKFRSKEGIDAETRRWVAELSATDCERERGSIQERKKPCKHGLLGWRK